MKKSRPYRAVTGALLLWFLLATGAISAETEPDEAFEFDDTPTSSPLDHPKWFKESFLDLPDDMEEALAAGKRGIIVYFGQRHCPYCQKLMEVNFGQEEIVTYTRKHFDLIPIDTRGVMDVTDFDGNTLSEHDYALREETQFTPSLIFYNEEGKIALRLRGYYPPYKFLAALEYVADDHYRNESFAGYLQRAEGSMAFEPGELNEEPFFTPPPYALDRSRIAAGEPLAVFFEQGECHACDILHAQPLQNPKITHLLEKFENVQLDIHADTPVLTPVGQRTTAKAWAQKLGLFYTPSIIFFDESGGEIMRLDSVVQFFRLHQVLSYIAGGDYKTEPSYLKWRAKQVR
ncbi:MAG: thioredoxin fold domain-containing protein [Candidatus Sedimenticola sp. (ex Thyasira tokunagai)]